MPVRHTFKVITCNIDFAQRTSCGPLHNAGAYGFAKRPAFNEGRTGWRGRLPQHRLMHQLKSASGRAIHGGLLLSADLNCP